MKKKDKKTLDFQNQVIIICGVETKKGCKMLEIVKEYEKQGYQFLGSVLFNQKALDAYRKSNKHEAIKVGRCLEIVLLHDIKKIVEYDFGD